jgi:dihydrofolate reductase
MPITMIAAVARNGTIGADGSLPWHLPEDFRRFKSITMGHTLIMGRRTYESIGRALPGRRTIVITRDEHWQASDADVAHSIDQAIDLAVGYRDAAGGGAPDSLMVLGGGDIYRQLMPLADRLEITHVDADVPGDTRFPDIDPASWKVAERTSRAGFEFVSYVRREPIRDLQILLSTMAPQLHDGEFVFCTVPAGGPPPEDVHPVVTVAEIEGITLVLAIGEAEAAGLSGTFRCRWITLMVASALDAVGLTAAVATALTNDGIPCNVIAGFHHDHLFVPVEKAASAMSALTALSHTRH